VRESTLVGKADYAGMIENSFPCHQVRSKRERHLTSAARFAGNISLVAIRQTQAVLKPHTKCQAKDKPVNVNDNGMRVLKRQNDGSWKFAVVGLK